MAFSILEFACQLSDSPPGHCYGLWPWRTAICSVIYTVPHCTNDPCLVLCALAHSLPWKFLSLHQSSGHDSIKDQFTVSRYYCLFSSLIFSTSGQTLSHEDSWVAPLNNKTLVNTTVNRMKTKVSSLDHQSIPPEPVILFLSGREEIRLWWLKSLVTKPEWVCKFHKRSCFPKASREVF